MAFWIKVDVSATGEVTATTFGNNANMPSGSGLRVRTGSTVSQALRNMAAAMVHAKAELVEAPND